MGLTSKSNQKEHARLNRKNTIRSQLYYNPISGLDINDRSYQLATTHFIRENLDIFKEDALQRLEDVKDYITNTNNTLIQDITALSDQHASEDIFFDYNLPLFLNVCNSIDSRLNILESYTYNQFTVLNLSSSDNKILEWVIPYNTNSIKVELWGSQGMSTSSNLGGKGGYLCFTMNVSVNSRYYFHVGSQKTFNKLYKDNLKIAEYNASDMRTNGNGTTDSTSLKSRIGVAGGGGNASYYETTFDTISVNGFCAGGTKGQGSKDNKHYESTSNVGLTESDGGSLTAGGTKPSKVVIKEGEEDIAYVGSNGAFGLGGAGTTFDKTVSDENYINGVVGAGGSGWYGGSSGGALYHKSGTVMNGLVMGGAGGSSYTTKTLVANTENVQSGNGYIRVTRIS